VYNTKVAVGKLKLKPQNQSIDVDMLPSGWACSPGCLAMKGAAIRIERILDNVGLSTTVVAGVTQIGKPSILLYSCALLDCLHAHFADAAAVHFHDREATPLEGYRFARIGNVAEAHQQEAG
jgi:hypothetical protein